MNRLFLLLLLLPFSLFAQNYESMRVGKIDLVTENLPTGMAFDANAVRTRMQTKAGSYFSQNEFDEDLKMLSEDYDRVEPTFKVENNSLHIRIKLWLKPVVRDVYIQGNASVSDKKIFKELGLTRGEVFERGKFIEGFNKIKTMYVKKGYFETEMSYDVELLPGGQSVDVYVNICEGKSGKVGRIRVCGVDGCEADEIFDLMLTKRYNFFLSWYNGKGCYHPDMVEHDRLMITNFLQDQGFADATVEIDVEDLDRRGKIGVLITVDRGECYYVGNMSMSGNTVFDNQCIWDQFTFGCGSVYSPEEMRCTMKAITDLYGAQGYIDAAVDMEVSLRGDSNCYDIKVNIFEGEQYYVGLIKVFGNQCTKPSVILHESLLCPGEVFDTRRIEGTEIRLWNTGFFDCVNVYAVNSHLEDPCGERLYRDIYIEVEEGDTGNVGLFAGFSSIDRVYGGVEVSERNFNLAGLLRVPSDGMGALRGGGEYAHFKFNVGDRTTSYLYQWTKPYFMDTNWIVGFDLEKTNNRAISRGYEIKTYGGNVHAIYIVNHFLKYDFFYRALHTNNDIRDTSNTLLDIEGNSQGFISAVGVNIMYDSTNHPRYPTCGLRSSFLYELAGLGGNFDFMKFCYFNSYYYPLSRKGTLKFRGDLRFIHTYKTTTPQTLPLSERFYLGGETSVRGYRPYIIGPLFANNEPRGGVSSYLLSEEYQYNLLDCPRFDAFAFVDAGYVSISEFTVGQFAASVGLGLRLEVMRNMPITLGYGWPIHPDPSTTQRFFFAMGGTF